MAILPCWVCVCAGGIRAVWSAVGDLQRDNIPDDFRIIDVISPLVVADACPLSLKVSYNYGCFASSIVFDHGQMLDL